MNKLIIVLMLFITCSSAAHTPGDTAQAQHGPMFNFIDNDRAHDFEGVVKNTTVSYKVQFKNSGDSPLVISRIYAAPPYPGSPPYSVIATWPQKPVKPGKKGIIVITFAAKDTTGSFQNELLVSSNAAPEGYPLLYITGAIVPVQREHYDTYPDPIIPVEMLVPIIQAVAK